MVIYPKLLFIFFLSLFMNHLDLCMAARLLLQDPSPLLVSEAETKPKPSGLPENVGVLSVPYPALPQSSPEISRTGKWLPLPGYPRFPSKPGFAPIPYLPPLPDLTKLVPGLP